MNVLTRVLSCLLVLVVLSAPAIAEDELIGTTVIAFGQPLEAFYPNILHPDPSVKVMSFTGMATNFGSQTVRLGIHFDYLDTNGVHQIVPLPNFYQNAIPPGGIDVVINAGPIQLPYCPPEVSIHFELLDPGEVEFMGIFNHTCVPIPEPSTWALGLVGVTTLSLVGWRRRQRRRG